MRRVPLATIAALALAASDARAEVTIQTYALPSGGGSPHGVIIGPDQAPWITEGGTNAIVRFHPETETFDAFPSDRRGANVRQILGRPGEVWVPESGADRLAVFRVK